MSEQEWLGGVPIYRYDPKAPEVGDLLAEGQEFCFVNPDGEVVATGVMGPKTKTVDEDGELWSISLLDMDINEEAE